MGALLIGFLFRYGRDFDYRRTAVAAGRASGVMRASDLPAAPGPWGGRPMVLAEDPQESGRNITAAAYRFREVKALFHAAGEAMSAEGELTFLTELAAAATRPPTWNDAEEEPDEDPYPIGNSQAEFRRDLEDALPTRIDPEARKNTTGRRRAGAGPSPTRTPRGKAAEGNGKWKGKGKGKSGRRVWRPRPIRRRPGPGPGPGRVLERRGERRRRKWKWKGKGKGKSGRRVCRRPERRTPRKGKRKGKEQIRRAETKGETRRRRREPGRRGRA